MEFTGERFLPDIGGDIAAEHRHRYVMARGLVANQTVLDIACGEGYGSHILAQTAARVFGVDISPEAVQHAQSRYQAANLEYRAGSATQIPLDDASVDWVVSFETIEHHDQHDAMMRDIKRVLKPNGQLLISSPNKYYYSIVPGYQNPYHVKELLAEEFRALLQKYFRHYKMFGQRIVAGSLIIPEGALLARFESFVQRALDEKKTEGLSAAVYEIALASDGEVAEAPAGLFELSPGEQQRLAGELTATHQEIARLNEVLEKEALRLNALQQETQGLTASLHEMRQAKEDLGKDVLRLQSALDAAAHSMEATLNSTSWRITAALRWLMARRRK